MKRPVIAIFLSRLNIAGIQRMRINLAKKFVELGFDVHIVVRNADGFLRETIPDIIPIVELAPKSFFTYFPKLFHYLATRKPTHILSSYEDITLILLIIRTFFGFKFNLVTSTHNALSHVKSEKGFGNLIKYRVVFFAMRLLYAKATAIVAVSQGLAEEVAKLCRCSLDMVKVIYNPVIADNFKQLKDEEPAVDIDLICLKYPIIGFFGRLHPQKRIDILIQAFSLVHSENKCKLLICGSGKELSNLKILTKKLKLLEDIIFLGDIPNPFPVMRRCNMVVLSSDYEGLGNVLVEAMACGVQVASTNCPYGPSEILEDGRLGQLVPTNNPPELARAIKCSLSKEFWIDPELLIQASSKFSLSKAAEQYLSALGLPKHCGKDTQI